jgi:hypothetical protein
MAWAAASSCARSRAGFVASLSGGLFEPLLLGAGGLRFGPRLAQLIIERQLPYAGSWSACRKRPVPGDQKRSCGKAEHRLSLPDDRGDWQGWTSPGTIARQASPGPARCGQVAGPNESSRSAFARSLVAMPVGAADREARLALAAVAPFLELAASSGRQRRPSLVEQDIDAVGGKRRRGAAVVGKLGDPGRPGDPLQIALDQLGFRRTADLSASDDVKEQITGEPNAAAALYGQPTTARKPS